MRCIYYVAYIGIYNNMRMDNACIIMQSNRIMHQLPSMHVSCREHH